MSNHEEEYDRTVTLVEWEWNELCELGSFRCSLCTETPSIWDAEIFVSEGTCGRCAAKVKRWDRE